MASPTKSKVTWLIFFIVSWTLISGQEDSLRSALNAIDRRQRDLSEFDEEDYGYPLERPEDLTFLRASTSYSPDHSFEKSGIIGRPLINYAEDDRYNPDDVNTRISSAFRERIEEDNQKQLDELARDILSNTDNRGLYTGDNEELLRELWEKYRRPVENSFYPRLDKRDYYPQFGMDAIGLRKRNPNVHYDGDEYENMYQHKHSPREDEFDDDDENYQMNYLRKRYRQRENKMNMIRQMYANPYSQIKRFPVSKRSSNYMSPETTHEEKRSVRKQTDPKVEKELSNIFGNKENNIAPTKSPTTTTKLPSSKREVSENKKIVKPTEEKKVTKALNKEELSPIPGGSEKPLQIKKKSIDWSDYFGLDRRKKSERNDLDKEWLIERYHKSIALPTKKRTAEVPLSSFRNHDEPSKKEFSDDLNEEKDKFSPEAQKIDDMDTKLKMLEDKIVDDALKYTGAHEGETDPKEIQDVKDRVISRLAEAYSLEKMRNALNEYKLSVAKEKEKLKHRKPEEEEYIFSEEKRVAVPRKQVVDTDRETIPEADNNIKCTDRNEKCHEQNYRTPSEILENHFGNKECPAIQAACNEIASAIGQYGEVFKGACNMHEMCLLCSDNSWFSPTRQCNALFLSKAYDLCKGNLECQRAAQGSIPYLLDVNRSLHSQGASTDDCELSCPETDAMANPSDTR
ncbi:uncharacterized protein LOC108916688 [Anoplophora glabripennis]|uniref:uncharacterized protein LOC108916688 n=1 Tax=Anoplophora glabripennis TaxID=217634 RepID=UPI00087498A3|nr:uncharacterized protein LOC108916688 [Anoplophora glabripennis]